VARREQHSHWSGVFRTVRNPTISANGSLSTGTGNVVAMTTMAPGMPLVMLKFMGRVSGDTDVRRYRNHAERPQTAHSCGTGVIAQREPAAQVNGESWGSEW